MATILLVEDDASVREAVSLALETYGHEIATAVSGNEALDRWRQLHPDLLLLDLMLPGIDGFEVCRTIRKVDQVPIIMLTARSDPIDVVVGLESGADDYVTKPFEVRVLLARIAAVLRREGRGVEGYFLRFGHLVIDPRGMSVSDGAVELALTHTEFRLLVELANHAGQVMSRELLLERVWNYNYLGDSRLVDVCVQRLRAKVERAAGYQLIKTVRGAGYKLVGAG
jgi:two-component system response regulator MtrA